MKSYLRLFMPVFVLLLIVLPPSHAQAAPYDIDECNAGLGFSLDAGQYTQKIVNCLESTVEVSIDIMLDGISRYATPTVAAMMTFAIIIFGFRIASGERGLQRKAIGFLFRLGLVLMFSYNLGGFGHVAYDVMHELICTVSFAPGDLPGNQHLVDPATGYCYSPWGQLDGFVGRLFGFGTSISIVSGLLGIIGSALFSSVIGGMLFMVGIMAILDILFFVIRIIFTYMTAVIVIGFLVVISPLIIPLALFYNTEIYFKRWLDVMLSAMLTPVLLFAFLQLFLGVFDHVVNEKILATFSCENSDASTACDFSAYTKTNQSLFSWMLPADPNFMRDIEAATGAKAAGLKSVPAVPSNIDPTARRAQNIGVSTSAVNFGPSNSKIMQQLIYGLLVLWLYTTLMKSMIRNIPQVASNIAGAFSGVQVQNSSFEPVVNEKFKQAKNQLTGGK